MVHRCFAPNTCHGACPVRAQCNNTLPGHYPDPLLALRYFPFPHAARKVLRGRDHINLGLSCSLDKEGRLQAAADEWY